jgi:hypothetical protein
MSPCMTTSTPLCSGNSKEEYEEEEVYESLYDVINSGTPDSGRRWRWRWYIFPFYVVGLTLCTTVYHVAILLLLQKNLFNNNGQEPMFIFRAKTFYKL